MRTGIATGIRVQLERAWGLIPPSSLRLLDQSSRTHERDETRPQPGLLRTYSQKLEMKEDRVCVKSI
ncbi:hypothetical protein Y1Q_0018744 [Alligator mississippiensis]|uniref:Uncharacterized protein n=1 Tax=Alligator mississippiensis TaxID=8496 RepID=A0A151NS85_ALLMI|nr:hypothetical protein Y1Q_0018744 [Alligator mississippiensis]